jgi:hypothetical protein
MASTVQAVGSETKGCGGLRPSFSAHVRWCEGHPCGSVGAGTGLRERSAVSHISRKTSEMPRISCTQLWKGPRVRLSLRRGAGSSGNPRNYTGNRGCGAPGDRRGDRAQKRVHLTRKAALTGLDSCYDYMLWFRPACWEKNNVSKKFDGSIGGLRGRSGNLNLYGKRPART